MTTGRTIPFARPWLSEAERGAVLKVLWGDILTHGPETKTFEEGFAGFVGGGAHCVAVSSCMAALHLAYLQLGIGPGDEVLVPAETHVATAHAVEAVGARPVFVDCEAGTGNMDVDKLEALVTGRTRAIGLVHFVGIPCNMDAILAVAQRHGLRVIEDCALALGARYRGKHVGTTGDAGCFSFYPTKHITTGEGGMFVSRHHDLAEKVRKARGFGVDRNFAQRAAHGMYDVPTWGLNYRMSDINAALGRTQLGRLGEILARRRKNFTALKRVLSGQPHLHVLDAPAGDAENSHYCLSVVLEGPLAGRRDELTTRLKECGVGVSVYYPQPVPRMAYYCHKYGYDPAAYPQAAIVSDRSIALPVGPHLAEGDVEYIVEVLLRQIREVLT